MTDSSHPAEEALRRSKALEAAEDLDGALVAMSQAVDLAPDSIRYRGLRGRLLSLKKQWRAAIRDYDSVLAIKPNAPTILYSRGLAKAHLDELDGAVEDFERCIAIQPTAADAYEHLGSIHYFRGELQKALEAYRKAMELDQDSLSGLAELHIPEIEQKLGEHREEH